MQRTMAFALVLAVSACREPPPDPAILGYRAAVEGEHEAAASHYAAATEARPDDSDAWLGLARERLRAGLDATEAAERAVELRDSADAQELLGRALLASPERGAEAVRALERSLELAPDRARIHFALGRAHEAAGAGPAAAEAYRSSAKAGVLPARSHAAAVRVSLDGLADDAPSAEELENELEEAEAVAAGDEPARRAIAAQRRRLDARPDPELRLGDLLGEADSPEGLGAIGLDSLFRDSGSISGGATLDDGMDEPSFGERMVQEGFGLGVERRPGPSTATGTLGTGGEMVGPTGGRGSRRLDE